MEIKQLLLHLPDLSRCYFRILFWIWKKQRTEKYAEPSKNLKLELSAKTVNGSPLLYSLETSQNLRFSDIFREYRSGEPLTIFAKSSILRLLKIPGLSYGTVIEGRVSQLGRVSQFPLYVI